MKHLILVLLFSVTAASSALGQQAAAPATAWLNEADTAKVAALRKAGVEALYNLDYEGARKQFKEIAQLFPNHPAGPQFLATCLWIETLYENRRLQSSLYDTQSFYSEKEDKIDPSIVEQFRTWTREAKRLTEARRKAEPRDPDAFYYLGAIQGLKASFEEAVERRHFAALRDGSDAVDYHRDVMRLDPSYHDAEITIGLYEYVVGSLPLPAKILAGIGGIRGSKKRGLATLERVAKESKWAQDDAKSLLIVLYGREKRYAEAAEIARELGARYPRNYLFRLEAADALVSEAAKQRDANHADATSAAETEAFATFETLLRDRAVRDTAARSLDLIHFKYGEALMTAGLLERAAKEFLVAAEVKGAQQGLATMAHLYAAHALDLAGKRNDALSQYRTVLARPDVYDAHEEAQAGLKEAFRKEVVKKSEE
ncbi:MAG: hypothetical protein QOE77_1518 [Blastocatellia bacterium]|jgi:hypothetical protein|nr:hypothetical protein [Blastocatellia bacterium]